MMQPTTQALINTKLHNQFLVVLLVVVVVQVVQVVAVVETVVETHLQILLELVLVVAVDQVSWSYLTQHHN